MRHPAGRTRQESTGRLSGVSILDVALKLGLFALSMAVFYLGSLGYLPVKFHTAALVSILIGFVLLNMMGTSVSTIRQDIRDSGE